MKAIILAAGQGSRLLPHTLTQPKCLLKVGDKTLIERLITNLERIGIKDILVVVGYQKEQIQKTLGDRVRYREYPDFAKTNNLHTLWHVRDELDEPFLCCFADVMIRRDALERAVQSPDDICLIVDTKQVLAGTMRVRLNGQQLLAIGKLPIEGASGNFVGIAKFSAAGCWNLRQELERLSTGNQDAYYTLAVDSLAKAGHPVGFIDIRDSAWLEVDTQEDWEHAQVRLPDFI